MNDLKHQSTESLIDSIQRNANGTYWLGLITGAAGVALISIAIHKMSGDQVATQAYIAQDVIGAYRQGADDALKTNPPSFALEYSCLELWANKQK